MLIPEACMQQRTAACLAIVLLIVPLASSAMGQAAEVPDPDLPDPDIPYPDQPHVSWHLLVVYEIDEETRGIEDYTTYGGNLPEKRCRGGWALTSSGASPAFTDEEEITYAVDATGTSLRVDWTRNGTRLTQQMDCRGQLRDVAGQEPLWEIQRFEHPNGTVCKGSPDLGDRRVAPRSQGFVHQAPAGSSSLAPCLEARAGGSLTLGDPVPFTGQVTATLEDDAGRTVVAETCTMIGGACWSGGQAWNATPDQAEPGSTWTLSCEADSMFGIRMPTAGDFGCEAWLPG